MAAEIKTWRRPASLLTQALASNFKRLRRRRASKSVLALFDRQRVRDELSLGSSVAATHALLERAKAARPLGDDPQRPATPIGLARSAELTQAQDRAAADFEPATGSGKEWSAPVEKERDYSLALSRLYALIPTLPEGLRQAATLYHVEGLLGPEIAERLALSRSWTYELLEKAYTALLEQIREEDRDALCADWSADFVPTRVPRTPKSLDGPAINWGALFLANLNARPKAERLQILAARANDSVRGRAPFDFHSDALEGWHNDSTPHKANTRRSQDERQRFQAAVGEDWDSTPMNITRRPNDRKLSSHATDARDDSKFRPTRAIPRTTGVT